MHSRRLYKLDRQEAELKFQLFPANEERGRHFGNEQQHITKRYGTVQQAQMEAHCFVFQPMSHFYKECDVTAKPLQ